MKKRRIVFVVLYAVLIFINTIPIFIYRDKVQTAFSWLFLAVMLLELIYGIFCCVCKHKANFFRNYRRIHLFWKNDESTFTAEYQREFDCYAMIFFSSLPFYIPLIHFAAEPIHTLWGLLVLAFPWIAFSMIGIRDTISEAKKNNSRRNAWRKNGAKSLAGGNNEVILQSGPWMQIPNGSLLFHSQHIGRLFCLRCFA